MDPGQRAHCPGLAELLYEYYGDNFKIEGPAGLGHLMNLFEVAKEILDRLAKIFLCDEQGDRPVYGAMEKFQCDPHWRDNITYFSNISTATTVRASAPAIDRLDRVGRRVD